MKVVAFTKYSRLETDPEECMIQPMQSPSGRTNISTLEP